MPTRGQEYLALNPKGATPRDISLLTNEMLRGKINCVNSISIPNDTPPGVYTVFDPNCHYGSAVFFEPKNKEAHEFMRRAFVSDIRDGEYDVTIANPLGVDIALMRGDVNNFVLDIVPTVLSNYTQSVDSGQLDNAADPVSGIITIQKAGLYAVSAYVVGEYVNNGTGESAAMNFRFNGVDNLVDLYDISNNKITKLSFQFTIWRSFVANDTIAISMEATGNLGVFNTDAITFEVVLAEEFDLEVLDAEFNTLVIG